MKFFSSCSGSGSLSSSFCSGRAFPHPFGRGAPRFFGVLRGFRRMFAVPAVSVVGSAVRVVRSVRPRVRVDGRGRVSHREDSGPPFGAAQRASGAAEFRNLRKFPGAGRIRGGTRPPRCGTVPMPARRLWSRRAQPLWRRNGRLPPDRDLRPKPSPHPR